MIKIIIADWIVTISADTPDDTVVRDQLLALIKKDESKKGIDVASFLSSWTKLTDRENTFQLKVFVNVDDTLESNGGGGLSPTPGPTPKKPPAMTEFPAGVTEIKEPEV